MPKANQHVLVIGGTSGIGLALAESAHAQGCKVTIAATTTDPEVSVTVPRMVPGAAPSGVVCASNDRAANIMQRAAITAVPHRMRDWPRCRRIHLN